LIAQNNHGIIGPFYDEGYLLHCFEELVKQSTQVVMNLSLNLNEISNINFQKIMIAYLKEAASWYEDFIGEKPSISFESLDKLVKDYEKS
jgi:hypothetical protein